MNYILEKWILYINVAFKGAFQIPLRNSCWQFHAVKYKIYLVINMLVTKLSLYTPYYAEASTIKRCRLSDPQGNTNISSPFQHKYIYCNGNASNKVSCLILTCGCTVIFVCVYIWIKRVLTRVCCVQFKKKKGWWKEIKL